MCSRACLRRLGAVVLPIFLLALSTTLVDRAEPASYLAAGGGRPETMSGHFTGVVTTFFVDREVVQSWLPSGLRLSSECPFEDHPVIILFGTQRDLAREGAFTFKPRYTRNGRSFHEAFVGIPYLELVEGSYREPVLHFVRVYLDHPKPASQGARRDGWPKILAAISAGGQSYQICHEPWGTILRAETDYGDLRSVEAENDSLRQLQAMFSQPLVLKHKGCFHFSRFDFHFNTATIRAVSSHVEIGEGFLPGLGPMEIDLPGIDQAEFGAFTLDCRYTRTVWD